MASYLMAAKRSKDLITKMTSKLKDYYSSENLFYGKDVERHITT